jgi:DNA-binding LacI/PurR family transcriptional regulator
VNDSRRRATLKEVAREVGVSAKTVSNAFNRPDQLSAELRERILETARRLDYAGPDPLARAFRQGRSGMVGVIYDSSLSYAFDDPAAVAFLGGFAGVIERVGMGLTLIPGSAAGYGEPRHLANAMIDAVVAYSLASDDPALENARQRGLPLVTVDQPRLPGVPWIGIDDEAGTAEIAGHIVGLGHRRIGIVSFGLNRHPDRALHDLEQLPEMTYGVSEGRMAGYARVLLGESGIGRVPVAHMVDSTQAEGAHGTRLLLDRDPRITAILCLSDRLALGAYATLEACGADVPGDVSVTGFDGIDLGQHIAPTLTTVAQPHREKGRLAGRALVNLLGGKAAESSQTLPHTFLPGASSTAPRR